MPRYSAILFDLGNTLVYRIVTQERMLRLLCDESGVPLPASPDYRGAVSVWRAYHSSHYLAARTVEEESDLARREAAIILNHLLGEPAGQRFAESLAPGLQNSPRWWGVYDDVPHVLDTLKSDGATLGVVSDWEPSLPDFCRRMGLAHSFQATVSSVAEGIAKPSPRLFSIALERVGAEPATTLYVGDDYRMDIVGARAAGITPVLIDRNDRFLETDCLKIRRLDEVLDIVAGSGLSQPSASVCISGFAF